MNSGMPATLDKPIQQILLRATAPIFDYWLSHATRGRRSRFSVNQTLDRLKEHILGK